MPIHEYRLDGNGNDSAGSADGLVGGDLHFTSLGVPIGLGQSLVFAQQAMVPTSVFIVPEASFTPFGTSNFSIAFYMRRDHLLSPLNGVFDCLGTDAGGWRMELGSDNRLNLIVTDEALTSASFKTNSAIADQQWHFLVVSVDREDPLGAKWYIDGVLDSESDPTGIGSIPVNSDLQIGALAPLPTDYGLAGEISLVRFYLDALSASDVALLADPDGDGVPLTHDLCLGFDDTLDADNDTVPDGCDICPGGDDLVDGDYDGTPDACDLCTGDAATGDSDSDGVCDDFDACAGDDASCSLPANIICVWPLAPGNQDGSNWYNAYRHLQTALQAATPGKEIWVAAGAYFPDGGIRAVGGPFVFGTEDQTSAFDLKPGVAIYGGFRGNEMMRSQRDIQANETILDGHIEPEKHDFFQTFNIVHAGAEVDTTAILDGFTIKRAVTSAVQIEQGSPTIRNCRLVDNSGLYAAIDILDGSPTISDCTIRDNAAVNSAVYLNGGAPTFIRCRFMHHDAYRSAVFSEGSDVTIRDCMFLGNLATSYPGALYLSDGNESVINCVFSANGGGGGAAYASGGDTATGFRSFVNCTFVGNHSIDGTGGLGLDGGTPTVSNCVFWGNSGGAFRPQQIDIGTLYDHATPSINFCDVEGGWAGAGVGNIDADPLFVDVDGPDNIAGTEDDDLRVMAGSPVIDAGANQLVPQGIVVDIAGLPRFVTCAVDMGAYEYAASPVTDSDSDGYSDNCDTCAGVDDRMDIDGDGVPDGCDVCFGASNVDSDADGLCDDVDACPLAPLGDVNNDMQVNIDDVAGFVAAVLDPASAPGSRLCSPDMNMDGRVDGLDIQLFVDLLIP